MHIGRSVQKWFVEIGGEELDWLAQSPDLNPIEHLWDELDRRLQARPNRPTSVPNLTNALVAEWKQVATAMFWWKAFPFFFGFLKFSCDLIFISGLRTATPFLQRPHFYTLSLRTAD